jgi:hypothetical protein
VSAFAVKNSDRESISSEKISTSPSAMPASWNPFRMANTDTPWMVFVNVSTPCR